MAKPTRADLTSSLEIATYNAVVAAAAGPDMPATITSAYEQALFRALVAANIGGGGISTPIATTQVAGKVKPDGSSITVEADGTIHAVGGGGSVPIATADKPGIVQPSADDLLVDLQGLLTISPEYKATVQASIAACLPLAGGTMAA